jgi:hypothetical protein
MSAANAGLRPSARWLWAGFVSLAVAGVAVGWLFIHSHLHTFDLVYALVLPFCIAALCTHVLLGRIRHASWLVPLQLVGLMLTVASHPQVLVLSALGVGAGSLAIAASVRGHGYAAVAGTLLCGGCISASLLVPLLSASQ